MKRYSMPFSRNSRGPAWFWSEGGALNWSGWCQLSGRNGALACLNPAARTSTLPRFTLII